MDDAVLESTRSVFLFIARVNNHLSAQRRTINWWPLDFDIATVPAHMWSAQGGSCKVCVYIFIYVCIYNIPELSVYWILGAVHPRSLGMSASTHVTWHLNACGVKSEGVLLLLQVVPFFSLSLSLLRSLFFCSSVTGGSRVASVDGYSALEEGSILCWAPLCSAAWKQICSRDAGSDFCSGWMYRSSSEVKVQLY